MPFFRKKKVFNFFHYYCVTLDFFWEGVTLDNNTGGPTLAWVFGVEAVPPPVERTSNEFCQDPWRNSPQISSAVFRHSGTDFKISKKGGPEIEGYSMDRGHRGLN